MKGIPGFGVLKGGVPGISVGKKNVGRKPGKRTKAKSTDKNLLGPSKILKSVYSRKGAGIKSKTLKSSGGWGKV